MNYLYDFVNTLYHPSSAKFLGESLNERNIVVGICRDVMERSAGESGVSPTSDTLSSTIGAWID